MKPKKNKNNEKKPNTAPGLDDYKFGEKASPEDTKNGNSTKVTRVFLDENDPS